MKPAIIIVFYCFPLFVVAQNQKQLMSDSVQIDYAASYYVETASLSLHTTVFYYPFDSIFFKDVRFDTGSIGASNKLGFWNDQNKFRVVRFADGLPGFLNQLLNNQSVLHNNAANDKLVCYIKKFRVTEIDTAYERNIKKERQVKVRSAIEAYYVYEEKMYPAYRTDTSFLQMLSENKTAYFVIDSLMQSFCSKVSRIDKAKMLKKRPYTEAYVDSVYGQRFNIPILTTESYTRGVYLSVNEFFSNNPSIKEYEWRSDKKVNLLYTKDEHGQWQVTRKEIFGFCDGTHIWFMIDNNFYPAFRRENCFQFIAPVFLKRISIKRTPVTSALLETFVFGMPSGVNKDVQYNDKSIYEIDMETGEFY